MFDWLRFHSGSTRLHPNFPPYISVISLLLVPPINNNQSCSNINTLLFTIIYLYMNMNILICKGDNLISPCIVCKIIEFSSRAVNFDSR